MLNDEQHTAIHEAGHAVIGRVLGLKCGHVTIIPNYEEAHAGHSITYDPWETVGVWERQAWERQLADAAEGVDLATSTNVRVRNIASAYRASIITLMAGAVAEAVILGRFENADGFDLREIDKLIMSGEPDIPIDGWSDWEPRLRRQTRRLVRKHRDKIIRLAAALREHKTIDAEVVDMIVNGDN